MIDEERFTTLQRISVKYVAIETAELNGLKQTCLPIFTDLKNQKPLMRIR